MGCYDLTGVSKYAKKRTTKKNKMSWWMINTKNKNRKLILYKFKSNKTRKDNTCAN